MIMIKSMIGPDKIVYLDNNATTQLDPAVLEEMLPFLTKYYGNPSGGYRFGVQVREAIELARERVAGLLGCLPGEVVFTSGGTESDNAALHSALQMDPARQHVVTTAVEHSAVRKQCEALAAGGGAATFLGVDEEGQLDLEELERAIRPETALISVMWANNETGVLFPVEEIAALAQEKRVLFHIDGVQAIGKVPARLADLSPNFCSVSAHKFHGPKGVGALYVNRRTSFRASTFGGGQEEKRRAGTENVASIVGFGKAAELAAAKVEESALRVRALRDRFEQTLLAEIADTFVNGGGAPRLPNTSSLSFAGVESNAALVLFDQQNLCCSAGSACLTGSLQASPILRAMGLSDERLRGTVRFSFGRFNTEADVERAVEIIPRAIEKIRSLAPREAVAR
ncbi:MAG: aminotransferase class V-fold PLP-dependent enzyme [Chthoniobacterales bacterium]